jgi:transposase
MDMSNGFIKAVRENFENREKLVCFDRFHVSQYFNQRLDQARRKEQKELEEGGRKSVLCGSRYGWLVNGKRRKFNPLMRLHLRTARAWRMKETAGTLWEYSYPGLQERNGKHY